VKDKIIVGYTQGSFDLFHRGHLNLLQKAKQLCDLLYVGVNTDKLIENYKGKSPIYNQNDRVEIVESLEIVDGVILCDTLDKEDAYQKIKFDKLFIGSDWEGSKRWNETEEMMKKKNVEVIYLPYTEGISSSIIREKMMEESIC
jgi:glycerol-3-phosphate cytidylyltransferase